MKLPEENIGEMLQDILMNDNYFVQEVKAQIDKCEYIKLKSFCTTKKPINNLKRCPQNGRKYLQTTHVKKMPVYILYKVLKSIAKQQ
jgi:hypothetical protein